jgi:hypothetical protein
MQAAAQGGFHQTLTAWRELATTPQGKTQLADTCKAMLASFAGVCQ